MANEVRTSVMNVLPQKNIDVIHDHCHQGKVSYNIFAFSTMATATTMQMAVVTSSGEVHWHPKISVSGPIFLDVFENTVYGATGTLIQNQNYNRNFTTSCGTLTFHSSVASGGTNIWSGMIVGDTAGGNFFNSQTSVGGSEGTPVEFILKPNTNYRIQLINAAFSQIQINYHNFFYEE